MSKETSIADGEDSNGVLIISLRGMPVILAHDLAAFFETNTSAINQYRSRNKERFSDQFAFQLSDDEVADLKSQNVISRGHGGSNRNPWAYTEHGVAMVSMGMKGDRAIELSSVIIDTFVQYRRGTLPTKSVLPSLSNDRLRTLRFKIYQKIEEILSSTSPLASNKTVGDELGELAKGAMSSIKALIDNPKRKDEKLSAEIAKIIAEADKVYAETRRIHAETDGLEISNMKAQLELIRELRDMAAQIERDEWVGELGNLFDKPPLLAAPGDDEQPINKV